mgnify:CR=1 FL=1
MPLVILLIPMAIGALFSSKFSDNYRVIYLLTYVELYYILFDEKDESPLKKVKE